jgi:uncharacterized protein (DUF885 family)
MTHSPVKHCLLALAIAAALGACATAPPAAAAPQTANAQATAPAQDKARRLDALYAQYWEENLALNPLAATYQGDPRYNDQLPNFLSEEYREKSRAFTQRWLDTVQAVGPESLQGQALLSYQIFVRNAQQELAGYRFPGWQQPINQFYNFANTAVQLGSGTGAQPFKTVQDYDNWLKRAAQIPVVFDQAIANSRVGMRNGVVQPRVLMLKVIPQLDALIKDRAEDTLFWRPITTLPDSFSPAEKNRLTADYRRLIEAQLMPAYRELRDFIANDYLPATRDTVGLDKLPNGEAWYANNVRETTTTDLTPAQIHQIGLDEVARIHGEIRKVMTEVGYKGDMQAFFKFMADDPQFTFESEDALLAHYRSLEDKVNQKVPALFSLTPKASFEIRAVEPFRAQSASGGSYTRPSEDGTRPGIFYVNTYDLPSRQTWDAEDLFLHEAIPGHHFQLALQQELTDLPTFRRFGREIAFSEGWGLYAESLGRELGLYQDPYSYFGYLQNELWRAIRLVVDTGLHSKDWTREQVIAYMLENSATAETPAISEAERYMAIPAQALAYKMGELKIKELRARSEKALGDKFDIREFHAEVLKDGSVPLDVLEAKIDRWIASKQA